MNSINRQKLCSLIAGIIGIYTTFMIGGVLHQYILKQKYVKRIDGSQTYFDNASGLIAVQKIVIFSFGWLYNKLCLVQRHKTQIPIKNSLTCAIIIFLSSITNNYAMILVSYPIIIMFKSCNILGVILIGVCCSRVKSKELKLTGNKIITASIVTIGTVMFKIFDPEAKVGDQRKVQFLGLVLLLISLMADAFLPDFQAQIKEKYKPQPTVMLVEINKWCCIVSLAICIVSGQSLDFIRFCWYYPLLTIHLLSMASLAFIGHIFIYNMIKDFKQHIVPFVITTRKIISVGISMIYFRHASSFLQIIGIVLVFGSTLFEFIGEIMKSNQNLQKIPVEQTNKYIESFEQVPIETISNLGQDSRQRKDSDQQMLSSSLKK